MIVYLNWNVYICKIFKDRDIIKSLYISTYPSLYTSHYTTSNNILLFLLRYPHNHLSPPLLASLSIHRILYIHLYQSFNKHFSFYLSFWPLSASPCLSIYPPHSPYTPHLSLHLFITSSTLLSYPLISSHLLSSIPFFTQPFFYTIPYPPILNISPLYILYR